jgi:hypothetical protein
MSAPLALSDPLASALRYITDPYERGAATQLLSLVAQSTGHYTVASYTFDVFQARYGVQREATEVSYILTLGADLGSGPVTVEVDYQSDTNSGMVSVLIPAGTLPGSSFALPLPHDQGPILLTALRELPVPAALLTTAAPRWTLTALLGNTARLLWVVMAERQTLTAVAEDVRAQHHLLTARGASLDLFGKLLSVPRQLPAPYRLDLDTNVIALYHLDDTVAPVFDATHEHPGVPHGPQRGQPGRFNAAYGFRPRALTTYVIPGQEGGITIPDDVAFSLGTHSSFTIEMFARLAAPTRLPLSPVPGSPAIEELPSSQHMVLATKRAYVQRDDLAGWLLTVDFTTGQAANLAFTLTDGSGTTVVVKTPQPVILPTSWFHIAAVIDSDTRQGRIVLDGTVVASQSLGALGEIDNCADIGLGGDSYGNALMLGLLDEVRLSRVARTDFSTVLGEGGQPYTPDADTIALYHLDETDDWIDEERGLHYAINFGATRGVRAHFDAGLRFLGDPLPSPRCASERAFQQQLRSGIWDHNHDGAQVHIGPYARYGYRQGAIALSGLSKDVQPVFINDDEGIPAAVRGMLTTACYGFVPTDLDATIAEFQAVKRPVQEAIDYYGEWHGEPQDWFTQQYQQHGITAVYESCLPTSPAPTYVKIPAAPDFVLDAATSLTVEAFIRPDALNDSYPRAIITCRSSALREDEANANEAGWSLSIGDYQCIPNTLRWTVGDTAGNLIALNAGFSLADGAFHHVAGVIDRDNGVALLLVDGQEVGKAPLGPMGAIATASDILLGNTPAFDAPYAGLVDEVRLSRVAYRQFHPVLGESDTRYRQRLAIYQPNRLPTFPTLQRGVRALTLPAATAQEAAPLATQLLLASGPVPDVGQIDVLETDSTRMCASQQVRIVLAKLAPGQSIAADGTTPTDEATAVGPVTFSTEALVRLDDTPGLVFPTEGSRWMMLATARMLERMINLLRTTAPTAQITVQRAFDYTGHLFLAQGYALELIAATNDARVDLGVLGALAHECGAAYVRYDVSSAQPFVRVSVSAGAELDIAGPGSVAPGQSITLSIARPQIATPALLTWRVLRCGPGDALCLPSATTPTAQLNGVALGEITLEVSYPLSSGGVLHGVRTITIIPQTLDACAVVSSSGQQNIDELGAAGPPDADFRPEYLVRSDDARIDYASESARQMQLPLEVALLKLATRVAAEPGAPRLTVLAAYDATAPTLQAVGRGMIVAPSGTNLTAGRLGALAFEVGFSYIEQRRYPPSVYLSVPEGERFQIVLSPLQRLWTNARISGQGKFQATEFDAAGPPDANFQVGQLQPYSGPGVTFAAGVSNAMQPVLATALTALVQALQHDGVVGSLQVLAGFQPQKSDLSSVGRALLLQHPNVSVDRLAGYALQAGFGFVQYRTNTPVGPALYVAAYAAGMQPLQLAGKNEILLNTLKQVSIRPVLPLAGQLDWCTLPCCPAATTLSTALPDPQAPANNTRKIVQATNTGVVTLTASFSLLDAAEPYQFLLVPRQQAGEGETPIEPRLTKDQYDDLMNFLEAYHPLGVECITRTIRPYVHGFRRPLRWNALPTSATYPRYRVNR